MESKNIKVVVSRAFVMLFFSQVFAQPEFSTDFNDTTISPKTPQLSHRIQFDLENSAVSINVSNLWNNSEVTVADQLRTMLEFAFYKFKKVEVLVPPGAVCEFEKVLQSTLNNVFTAITSLNDIRYGQLYLDLPITFQSEIEAQVKCFQQLVMSTKEALNLLVLKVGLNGVHISGLNSHQLVSSNNVNQLQKFINFGNSSGLQVGLVLEQCGNPSLAHASFRELIPQLDYVVCHPKSFDIYANLNSTSRQLNNELKNSSWITKAWPKVDLRFRFTSVSSFTKVKFCWNEKILWYLQLISTINDFGRKYKRQIFLTQVLDDPKGIVNGWWQVSYKYVAYPPKYREKESEHFQEPTWKPFMDIDGILIWEVIGAGICVFVLVVFSVIYFLRNRDKPQILTKQDIQHFLYGIKETSLSFLTILGENNSILYMPYDKKYEICQSDIIFTNRAVLGSGYFGTVREALFQNQLVAVKMANKLCGAVELKSLLAEIKIMSYIDTHPNVIKFIGSYTKELRNGNVMIVTELCDGGDLKNYLLNLKPIQETDSPDFVSLLYKFACEIASGMRHIAGKNIVHKDLSAKNVLLQTKPELRCKIGDFGLSRKLYDDPVYRKKGTDPTPWKWTSYEALVKDEYSTASDIWSYGVVLWEIFSLGDEPFSNYHECNDAFKRELETGLKPGNEEALIIFAPDVYENMGMCWELEPNARPSFEYFETFFQQKLDAMERD